MGRQPQVPISSKPLLQHQEKHYHTFWGDILLMTLLQFGLQWGHIVDLLPHYFLHSFLMVHILSSVTVKSRISLFNRFQLVFKTVIEWLKMNSFSRTCRILTVAEIKKGWFSVFWSAAAWVVDMNTVTRDHNLRHAVSDEEITNNFLYAPNVLSVQELMDKAKELFTKTDGKT